MTRPYNWKPGNREKLVERMSRLMSDPVNAARFANMASRRMKAIHEAARKALKDGI